MKPTLSTARIRLRPFQDVDLADLLALDADPEVRRYVDLREAPTLDDVRAYTTRWRAWDAGTVDPRYGPEVGYWVAEDAGGFVGWFHLRPPRPDVPQAPGDLELGYRLRRDAWGRGLATEGARLLVDHAFVELGAPRVTAAALPANTASVRVMEKVGMSKRADWTYVAKDGAAWPAVLLGVDRG